MPTIFILMLIFMSLAGVQEDIQTYPPEEPCHACHTRTLYAFHESRHYRSFWNPRFQQTWNESGSPSSCLKCHSWKNLTEGTKAGVTCQSCHGDLAGTPEWGRHPGKGIEQPKDPLVCSNCHQGPMSPHAEELSSSKMGSNLTCVTCHDPHRASLKIPLPQICQSCHPGEVENFSTGTHASSKVECSSCHMFKKPYNPETNTAAVSGHTFKVDINACSQCHKSHLTRTTLQIAETEAELQEILKQIDRAIPLNLGLGIAPGLLFGIAVGWFGRIANSRLRERMRRIAEEERKRRMSVENTNGGGDS